MTTGTTHAWVHNIRFENPANPRKHHPKREVKRDMLGALMEKAHHASHLETRYKLHLHPQHTLP